MTEPTMKWTPLACLPRQPLTPAGLIQFDSNDTNTSNNTSTSSSSNEVELLSRIPNIELRSLSTKALTPIDTSIITPLHNKWIDREEDLLVTLTTHRIVFQTSSSGKNNNKNKNNNTNNNNNNTTDAERAHFLHWSNVISLEPTGGNWTSNRSYKIQIETHTYSTLQIIFHPSYNYNTNTSNNPKSDRDSILMEAQKALKRQAWLDQTKLQIQQQRMNRELGNKVGVDAILAKNRQRHERAAQLTNDAFGSGSGGTGKTGGKSKKSKKEDVDVFMREAGELVQVIQKYVATLDKKKSTNTSTTTASTTSTTSTNKDDQTEQQLTEMLQNMGMISSSSSKHKQTKSNEYHEILARQLSDFLQYKNRLHTAGGIMTLTDLYCLFNRARGSNMISPDDLWDAIRLIEKLCIGGKTSDGKSWCRLRQFEDSGVWVLQESGFDDDVMAQKLIEFIEQQQQQQQKEEKDNDTNGGPTMFVGLTTLDASRILRIPPMLAEEQLLSAERKGFLCRDITLESTRFYRNIFLTTAM